MKKLVVTLPEGLRGQTDTLAMQTIAQGYAVFHNTTTGKIEVTEGEVGSKSRPLEDGFPPKQVAHLRALGCIVEIL